MGILNDIGMVIHFRKDVPDRLRNLETVLKFYKNTGLEIVIVNDDAVPDGCLKSLHDNYGCKILFLENTDVYHRTLCFNKGVKELKSSILIAGDTDVLVSIKYLQKAAEKLKQNANIGIIWPYNGMFVHIIDKMAESFFETLDISLMESKIKDLKPEPYFTTEDFLVAHPQSKGGMVMFNKETFIKCNGYNPNFKGWGYEDDEILARFQKLGYQISRINDAEAIAWHLPHENTIREKHPYYENNRMHSDFVCGSNNLDELRDYINSWSI